MIDRVHLQKSKETGRYEIVSIEPLSEEECAERMEEAREKAQWIAQSRLRTAENKKIREIATNLIKLGLTHEQISEGTGISLAEVEALRLK